MATYGTKNLTEQQVFEAISKLRDAGYTNANDLYGYLQRDYGVASNEVYPIYQKWTAQKGVYSPTAAPAPAPTPAPAPGGVLSPAAPGAGATDLEKAIAASLQQGFSIGDTKTGAMQKYGVTQDQWNAVNWANVPGGSTGSAPAPAPVTAPAPAPSTTGGTTLPKPAPAPVAPAPAPTSGSGSVPTGGSSGSVLSNPVGAPAPAPAAGGVLTTPSSGSYSDGQVKDAIKESSDQGFSLNDSQKGAMEKYGVPLNQWQQNVPTGPVANQQSSDGFNFTNAAGQMQGPTSYEPSKNALVSEQLNKLLSKDSDYLRAATMRATQGMNARGLANSSMAAGAGVLAATEAALPIAQGDSQNYFTAERDNNQTINQFGRDSNQFGRDTAQLQYKGVLDKESQNRDIDFRRTEANTERTWKSGESALDRTLQTDMQSSDQDWRSGESLLDREWRSGESVLDRTFQDEQGAKAFSRELERLGFANDLQKDNIPIQFATTMAANLQQQVASIMADPEMSVAAKESAVRNLVNYSNATMEWAGRFYGGDFSRFSPTDIEGTDPSTTPQALPQPVQQYNISRGAPADFDAEFYLQYNPDVAAALERGEFGGDPIRHFLEYGKNENRPYKP